MNTKASPYRWAILCVIVLTYTIVIFHRMSPAVMADAIMLDLGVNAAFMGLLASAYYYPYAILQIPSGIMADKLSPRLLICVALLATSVGTVLFSMAGSTTAAFLGRLSIGIGCSLVLMPAYRMLANWFDQKTYVIIVTIVMAGSAGIASSLAGVPFSYFVENFGWRISTQGLAVISVIVFLTAWFLLKDAPKEADLPEEAAEALQEYTIFESIKLVLGKRNFWCLALIFMVNAAILFSFVGLWAGIYYTNVVKLNKIEMSSLLSVAATVTIITPIIFASIVAKVPSRKKSIFVSNALLLLVIAYLFFRNGSFSYVEAFAWAICLSVIVTAPAGLYMASARELYPKNIGSTANGLLYSIGMFGAAVYQPFIGFLLDKTGYTDMLTADMFESVAWLYLISIVLATLAALYMQEKDNKLL